jgi:hypothetical protein
MSTRFSLVLTFAIALTIAQSNANAGDWLTLNQPEFITASFDDPAPEAAAPVASCDLGACGTCNRTSCRCGCWTPGASVEATFLWPTLNGTTTFTQAFNAGGATNTFDSGLGATDDLFVAPRIWVGAKRDCWGVGARYWTMEQTNVALDPIMLDPDYFTASGAMESYTIDLEVTRDFCAWSTDMQLALGARYGWLAANEVVNSGALDTGVLSTASAMSARQFGGTGLTLALQGTRPLRSCCNLNLFWNFRGSVLWGDGLAAAATTASAVSGGGSAAAGDFAVAGDSGALFIGEVQLGLQYERQLKCAPCIAFVRGAFEYQYWDSNANVFAGAVSTANVGGIGSGALATAGTMQMDLYGFTLGTGLMW